MLFSGYDRNVLMVSYSIATVKKLFGRAGNHCAFPDCDEQVIRNDGHIAGEICHIKARSPGGPRYDPAQNDKERHAYENLILLCGNHHKTIDAHPRTYGVDVLADMKTIAETTYNRPSRSIDEIYAKLLIAHSRPTSIIVDNSNVAVNSSNVVQTSIFNFKSSSKQRIAINAPLDAIGSNGDAVRYIEYLFKRYNEYAKSETTRSRPFSFPAIRKSVESRFGSHYKLIPLVRFEDVINYLHDRITRTRIARINHSKGIKSFSNFNDFMKKQSG